ncbi:MAG: acyl-CoA thioesterase [Saprospiraceae bacterium]|nr:acyl-CoA thioesterase [Saprospiraceae bacterium]
MFVHEMSIRVRYGETDQMGYLYYGHYAAYFEVGRVEALRSLGLSYKELEEKSGIMMPVMSMQVRYLRPGFYDELLKLQTSIRKLPDNDITFHYEVFNEKNELINAASVKLCFILAVDRTTVPVPRSIVEALNPYFDQK